MSIRFHEFLPSQILWGLRRLSWGIPRSWLVLEVGSGGNPCPRSDVLVDFALNEKEHPSSRSVVTDRATVFSQAEKLPFQDNAFDFLITIHTLEHSESPSAFLDEISRVSKSGYIETPSPMHELLFPLKFHRSFVWIQDDILKIKMKDIWDEGVPSELRSNLSTVLSNNKFKFFYRNNPKIFNTQIYWNDHIKYEVFGSEGRTPWEDTGIYHEYIPETGFSWKSVARQYVPGALRNIMRYKKRGLLEKVLLCVICQEKIFKLGEREAICCNCGDSFPIVNAGDS
jgi:methyltransferase family protein